MKGSHTIAFGSCNRQSLPQDYWSIIAATDPSHFLWVGDVVYTKSHQAHSLREAYDTVLNNPQYQNFAKERVIDGVWDDHDYGVNDGGKDVHQRDLRQAEYVRFLTLSGNTQVKELEGGNALYHALDIVVEDVKVKVLFLDTRSQRDPHFIRSLGELKFPLSALISSAIRASYTVLGYGGQYEGKMLGDDQWTWFEDSLKSSDADVHVIVSSVQVMTSNPVFESWGHFPIERKKLFEIIAKHDPKGLVFLSGDVHLGELSSVEYKRKNGEVGKWVEVTSSGLTHTCGTSSIQGFICPIMMTLFQNHRLGKDNYYTGRNFGSISLSSHKDTNGIYDASIGVLSAVDGSKQLEYNFTFSKLNDLENVSPIDQIKTPTLLVLHPVFSACIHIIIIVVLYTFGKSALKYLNSSADKPLVLNFDKKQD